MTIHELHAHTVTKLALVPQDVVVAAASGPAVAVAGYAKALFVGLVDIPNDSDNTAAFTIQTSATTSDSDFTTLDSDVAEINVTFTDSDDVAQCFLLDLDFLENSISSGYIRMQAITNDSDGIELGAACTLYMPTGKIPDTQTNTVVSA